jgi:lariat debranching enzyme
MIVAVQGCLHGQLDMIYESVEKLALERNVKVDLLICCGDFEALRNEADLQCMAVPPHHKKIGRFYKYSIE